MSVAVLDAYEPLSLCTVAGIEGDPEGLDLLVARARKGDRRALEEVLRISYDRVFPVCRRITGNEADAADATQDALISVVRSLPRFDGRSRFSTWLYRIAVNAAIDELRRRSRRAEPGTDHLALVDSGAELDGVATAVDVEAALARLPVDFRAAVVLRDICGLDYEEIAKVLVVPIGTVRSRIARGRALLVRMLGPARSET